MMNDPMKRNISGSPKDVEDDAQRGADQRGDRHRQRFADPEDYDRRDHGGEAVRFGL